jgi:hypothetical protein
MSRFDLRTHESLILLAGLVGLIEQEAARLLFDLPPNSLLSGAFVTMVLASIGLGTARNVLSRKRNGENGGDSK